MISIIVAMSQNGVIGKDNKIPWHLSEDLKRFKQITMGHPIVMGRKTYLSIGKPLPGRKNIVITRNPDFSVHGVHDVHIVHSLDEALKGHKPGEEIFVIGGAEIYRLALPRADKIYLTRIEKEFEGDTYFHDPNFENQFEKTEETATRLPEKNGLPYRFVTFSRKPRP